MTNDKLRVHVTFSPTGRTVNCECSPDVARLIADILLANRPGNSEKVETFTVGPAIEPDLPNALGAIGGQNPPYLQSCIVGPQPTKTDGRKQKAIEALRAALGEIEFPIQTIKAVLVVIPTSPTTVQTDENLRKTVRCIETALYHLGYGDKPDHLQE